METKSVVTDDCYILTLHRIPHGKNDVTYNSKPRPAVYLQHGLLSSSADWVLGNEDNSLGMKENRNQS